MKTTLRDIDNFFNGKKRKLALIGGALILVGAIATSEPIPESEYIEKLNAEITELEDKHDELENKYNDSLNTQEELEVTIEEYKEQLAALNEKSEELVEPASAPVEEAEKVEEVEEEVEVVTLETMEKELSKLTGDKVTIEVDPPLENGKVNGYIVVEIEDFTCFSSRYKEKAYEILKYIQKKPIDEVTKVGIRFMVDGSEFLDIYGNPCTEPQLMASAWIEVETLEKVNFKNINYLSLYENEFLLSSYHFNQLIDDDIWN